MQFVGIISDDYCVSCVISALESDNGVIITAQYIYDLSFALISKLGTREDGEHISKSVQACYNPFQGAVKIKPPAC